MVPLDIIQIVQELLSRVSGLKILKNGKTELHPDSDDAWIFIENLTRELALFGCLNDQNEIIAYELHFQAGKQEALPLGPVVIRFSSKIWKESK